MIILSYGLGILYELGTVYMFFNLYLDRISAFIRARIPLLLFKRDLSRILYPTSSSITKELLRKAAFIFTSRRDDKIVALFFGLVEDSLLKRGEVVVYAF